MNVTKYTAIRLHESLGDTRRISRPRESARAFRRCFIDVKSSTWIEKRGESDLLTSFCQRKKYHRHLRVSSTEWPIRSHISPMPGRYTAATSFLVLENVSRSCRHALGSPTARVDFARLRLRIGSLRGDRIIDKYSSAMERQTETRLRINENVTRR